MAKIDPKVCRCGKPATKVECLGVEAWIPCVACTEKAGEEWEKWRRRTEEENRTERIQRQAPPPEMQPAKRRKLPGV